MSTLHISDERHFSDDPLIGLSICRRDGRWQAKKDLDFDMQSEYDTSGEPLQIFEVFDTYDIVLKDAHIEVSSTPWMKATWRPVSGDIITYLEDEVAEVKTQRQQFKIDGVLVQFDFFTLDPMYEPFWCGEVADEAEYENYLGRIKIRRQVTEDHFGREKDRIQHNLTDFVGEYKDAFRKDDFNRLGF
jgi:hypothetical protein